MPNRGNGKDVILQAFHWNLVKTQGDGTMDGREKSWYAVLLDMAAEISEAGFTVAYLPPPWRDDSCWEANGKHGGGEGYFWHDFDLNSRYGTKKELISLVEGLHSYGIKVIADLVTNHRDGARMKEDIWPYPGECWAAGSGDTGGTFMDGRYDLNLASPTVHGRFQSALNELMDECGIDGWRWDYVWGYDVSQVNSWIKNTAKTEYMSVGEYWQDSPFMTNDPMVKRYGADEGDRILGWARESSGLAFDIILKRQIQSCNPVRLKHGLNTRKRADERSSVVTFVDNHDMGSSPYSRANGWGQQCWPCPDSYKAMAYAFILTMPGTPCVYWPDFFDWGFKNQIISLIKLRKLSGITSSSEWVDLTDNHTGFAAIIKNHDGSDALAVSIGSNYCAPEAQWTKAYEKDGEFTVWINSSFQR